MNAADYSKYTIGELNEVLQQTLPDSPQYCLLVEAIENRRAAVSERMSNIGQDNLNNQGVQPPQEFSLRSNSFTSNSFTSSSDTVNSTASDLSHSRTSETEILELANSSDTDSVEAAKKQVFLIKHRVKIIGLLQLVGAGVIAYFLIFSFMYIDMPLQGLIVGSFFVLLSAIAGITAIQEKQHWYGLSIFNQFIQIPSFAIGTLAANYSGLGGLHLGLSWGTKLQLILSAPFSPGFLFQQYHLTLSEPFFEIDLIAVAFIVAIITAKKHTTTL